MAITGNYFDSGLDTRSSEYDSADDRPVFEDFLTVDGRKYSAIGQALYIKNFEKVAFSVGERFSYESNIAHTTSWLSGDRQERTTRMNNYLAAEVSGKIKTRFSYRFSLGVIASRTVTAGNRFVAVGLRSECHRRLSDSVFLYRQGGIQPGQYFAEHRYAQ